jgi:hypothetical protein
MISGAGVASNLATLNTLLLFPKGERRMDVGKTLEMFFANGHIVIGENLIVYSYIYSLH